MAHLSQKQINILLVLAKGRPIIAPWSNSDLTILEQTKLVASAYAMAPTGKAHTSKIWTLTDAGSCFLAEEREGL